MTIDDIGTKIERLPNHVIPEVLDFVDFLLSKYGSAIKEKGKFTFEWEGGLSKLKDKFTSVKLQHKASEWR